MLNIIKICDTLGVVSGDIKLKCITEPKTMGREGDYESPSRATGISDIT